MWSVFGIIWGSDGNPAGGVPMLFRPADPRARARTEAVVTRTEVRTTTAAGTGFFRVTLTPGKHYLWVGASRRIAIVVPEAPGENLLQDLLGVDGIAPELPGNFRTSNGVRQLINSTTGGFHTVAVTGADSEIRFAFATAGVGITQPNFRYREGMLELAHASIDVGTWHAPILQNGSVLLADDGATPVVNDRVSGGLWQLRDIVTGGYRSWWISGAAGQEIVQFGPETT